MKLYCTLAAAFLAASRKLTVGASSPAELAERMYSYSITTFDPSGKLGQVERAALAASRGTPLVGVALPNCLILSAPQVVPSAFILDDGTSRFAKVTSEIVVAHSGISADGRVVLAEAQRIAIGHEYVYDEEIPVEAFLQELSLLFQEYTMKAGTRPFGTTILVGYLPKENRINGDDGLHPCFFRIDPSGSVVALGAQAMINCNMKHDIVEERLLDLVSSSSKNHDVPLESLRSSLADSLRETIQNSVVEDAGRHRVTMLAASLSNQGSYSLQRFNDDELKTS